MKIRTEKVLISVFIRDNNNSEFTIIKYIFWKYTTDKKKESFRLHKVFFDNNAIF